VRTDSDSWDITTSVGSTALFAAAARALEAQKPVPLAVDPYAKVFCRAAGGVWADVMDGKAPGNRLVTEWGGHFVNFQGARTKYFDDYIRKAVTAGVRQVVIPAVGLDSRAYRLPWPDGTVVYELDRPKVLEFKRDVLTAHGAKPAAERREIAVDLRDDWQHPLKDNGFDPTKPSAWIVEGLMIYLPATAQGQLFAGIDMLAGPGSHVAVEEGEPMPRPVWESLKEAEVAEGGIGTFFTLIYNQQYAPAALWFSERGWTTVSTPLTDLLTELGRPLPAPDSEAGGMVRSNTLVSAART
jgi:methyltransferase (TIGR00027 family)